MGTYTRTAAQTDYTPTSNLPANIPLFWRVQTISTTYGPSAWSECAHAGYAQPAGGTVADGSRQRSDADHAHTRGWTGAPSPCRPGETWGYYEVQVATDSAFTNVVLEKQVDGVDHRLGVHRGRTAC